MAKDRPQNKNLIPWRKGVSGNPNGRPKTRADLKKVKLMGSDDIRRLLQKLLDMPYATLKELANDPETPAMEMMIIGVIDRGLAHGDSQRLNFLFDRTIGKILEHKEEAKLKPVTYVTNITPDGRLAQEIMEEEEREQEEEDESDM